MLRQYMILCGTAMASWIFNTGFPRCFTRFYALDTALSLWNRVDEVALPEMHISPFPLSEPVDTREDAGTPVRNIYPVKNHYPSTGDSDKVVVTLTDDET